MECLHPLLGVPYWSFSDKQQKRVFKYRVLGAAEKFFSEKSAKTVCDELSIAVRNSGYFGDQVTFDPFGNVAHSLLIPCGKCINCRLEYSRQWALRMCLERLQHREEYCWFLTLTYDDDHLHLVKGNLATCRMDDISSFMKRLREYYSDKYDLDGIRFYAATEYGDQTFRPHGHMILYGCPVPDLKPYDRTSEYFISELFNRLWSHGDVLFGEVSFESCSYVARYVTKKVTGKEYQERYEPFGIEQEKSRMSRMPGIGMFYFDPEIYGQIEKAVGPGRVFKRCAAFDRKMKVENPIIYEELKKEARRIVDLRLRSEPVSRSFVKRLEALEEDAIRNFSKKGQF